MEDFDTLKIWSIRHAEGEANIQRIYANKGCSFPLTGNGVQKTQILARLLFSVQVRAVYTSPLLRATQTAEEICKIKKIEMQIAPELSEYSMGIYEGTSALPGSAMIPIVFNNLDFNFVQAHPIEHLSIIKGELKNGRLVCVEYNGNSVSR